MEAEEGEKAYKNVLRLAGRIMDYQHILLRDYYDLSLPELESIRDGRRELVL